MNATARTITFTIVYNNIAHTTSLTAEWGMSCVIEGVEKCVLFDTGSDGFVLLGNMHTQGIHPHDIDCIFLSHIHWDHTGGLRALLEKNGDVEVVLPASASAAFVRSITDLGAHCTRAADSVEICKHVYSTGEMEGMGVREHALVIDTEAGLIVVTGCAHPGVAHIAARARTLFKKRINLLFGGFHLSGLDDKELTRIATQLHDLGVERVGPSHCTGERAMEMFQAEWKDNYIDLSLGVRFELEIA